MPSLAGRFYATAQNASVLGEARRNLDGIRHAALVNVPRHEQPIVRELASAEEAIQEIRVGDWMQIRRGRYRGDIARVREVTEGTDILTLAVVPRLIPTANGTRPKAEPFDADAISVAFPRDDVDFLSPNRPYKKYKFQGRLFVDGLLLLRVPSLHYAKKKIPPIADLGWFAKTEDSFGPLDAGEPFLKFGDRVRVDRGELKGLQGTAVEMRKGLVRIVGLTGLTDFFLPEQLTVPELDISRVFEVGQSVRMMVGPDKGRVGLLTSIEDIVVSLFVPELDKEV